MRRHVTFALAAAAVVSLAAGCGSDSSGGSATKHASAPTEFTGNGVRFLVPAGWSVQRGSGNLVATAASGGAAVLVWRYPRSEKLPRTELELKAARDGLVKALAARDAAFERIKTSPTMVSGQPAVQVRARETIAGSVQTVRSTHIYTGGTEIVIDAYAPDRDFRRVDAKVFRPFLRALSISAARDAA